MRLDPDQIRRVLINLVDNAIEAWRTAARGRVAIAASSTTSTTRPNGVARIVVADNGPGIPPADRERLFVPHYSTKKRGSGLGLAIVSRIVAEHGGTIEVRTTPPRGRDASWWSCRRCRG